MSDQGPSLKELRRHMEQKAAEIVEKQFPGLIQRTALQPVEVMSLSLKIGEENVMEVSSRDQISFILERQEVLAYTGDGEMIIFVHSHGRPETQGFLFHVKPRNK